MLLIASLLLAALEAICGLVDLVPTSISCCFLFSGALFPLIPLPHNSQLKGNKTTLRPITNLQHSKDESIISTEETTTNFDPIGGAALGINRGRRQQQHCKRGMPLAEETSASFARNLFDAEIIHHIAGYAYATATCGLSRLSTHRGHHRFYQALCQITCSLGERYQQ